MKKCFRIVLVLCFFFIRDFSQGEGSSGFIRHFLAPRSVKPVKTQGPEQFVPLHSGHVSPVLSGTLTRNALYIPPDWTYLGSGTHLLKRQWNDDFKALLYKSEFLVKREGLYTRTKSQMEWGDSLDVEGAMQEPYDIGEIRSKMNSEEYSLRDRYVMIRVLFPDLSILSSLKGAEVQTSFNHKTVPLEDLIRFYYAGSRTKSGRNPVVPAGTRLIKLGRSTEDIQFKSVLNQKIIPDVDIYYFIPAELLSLYLQALQEQGLLRDQAPNGLIKGAV